MRVVVIEDETMAANRLIQLLQAYDADIEVLAQLDTVASAVAWFQTHPAPELIFLDIELGDGKSFDIFTQVAVNSHIIFTTAFDEYAIQAFKYNSVDYLLKPLKKEELHFAMNKYATQVKSARPVIDLASLVQQLQPSASREYKTRFLVKKGSRFYSIEAKDVSHIFTRDRVQLLKTFAGSEYLLDSHLDELERSLDPTIFFRANRQFLLHYASIQEVVAWFEGKLKIVVRPAAYEDVIVSRLKANDFKKWLGR